MTDPHHKTIPDLSATRLDAATPPRTDAAVSTDTEPPTSEKEPFNPFKFQSITMPPGLRAEIIEHARSRDPEPVPEDTLPPSNGVTVNNPALNTAATIRIATDNADTERLPRVLQARAQQRGQRVAAVVVAMLATVAIGVAAWTHQRGETKSLAAPTMHRGDAVSPATSVSTSAMPPRGSISPSRTSVAGAPTVGASSTLTRSQPDALASGSSPRRQAPPTTNGLRPHRERASGSSEQSAPKPNPAATAVPKGASPRANGVDLLDFEGPAPK